ncbi:CBL-interacting protein kinase 29-like [Triticum aestivum]|nr:CBL-interacting protein kinase 29-like [Triticum aestivum]
MRHAAGIRMEFVGPVPCTLTPATTAIDRLRRCIIPVQLTHEMERCDDRTPTRSMARFRVEGYGIACYATLCCSLDPNPATRIETDEIMEHPWFCHDANDGGGEQEQLMRGHKEAAWFNTEFEEEMARDMTAFDILAFSPGSDLSGLSGVRPGTERVFVGEPAAVVLARVEDAGKKRGHRVRREGKNRTIPVFVEAVAGGIVAKVTVFRIAEALSVVEVVKGHDAEATTFWKDWLEPAMKPRTV